MKRLSALALVALAACNAPPTAPTVSVSPANPRTEADLKANIVSAASDPQGDAVTYAFAWLKDGAPQTDLVTDTVPAALTTKGQVWTAVVTPSDGKLTGPAGQAQATIANTPPSATLAFVPPDPVKGTPLKVLATGADADGDTVTFTYAWTKNGTATAFVTDTIPAGELARGQAWQVTVTPNDGTEAGQPVTGSVTVGNAKPVVASVALSPAAPTKATALAAQPAPPTDEDGDTVTLKYAWAVNGTVVDGQTGPNLATTFFQKGQVVTVTVTPNDGKEDGASVSANVTIGNSEPTAPLPGINARPRDSEDITCALVVSSTDLDAADSLSYAFTWTKNGQPFSGATVQGTSSVVAAALTAEGDTFACTVAVTDGTTTVPGAAPATTKVNARPVVSSVALNPPTPTKATTVSALPASPTDADSDVVTLRYQWLVNGSAVTGVSGTALSPSNFVKGDSVTVVVTPNDGIEDGTPATASVVVGNSPPTAPVATITASPKDADDITCSVSVPSADLDAADAVSYLFNWTRNGQAFSGASVQGTSSTIAASLTADGDVFACTGAATDGAATTAGGAVTTTVSNACGALVFNGVNTYLSVPSSASMTFTAGTVEAWILISDAGANQDSWIIGAQSCGMGNAPLLNLYDNKPCYQGGGSSSACSSTKLTLGAWHHVAGVTSPSGNELWIDGVLAATSAYDIPVQGLDWIIGGSCALQGYASPLFKGRIAAVRLSNSVRYSAPFAPPRVLSADSATMALWSFSAPPTSAVSDESMNGRTAIVNGTPVFDSSCR
ncbi:MAG: LamG domain-containing protein [Deltaproteobacteria bacterium]|nr:LamG domain-containing protein [Deltaproteobacteria bacterium]